MSVLQTLADFLPFPNEILVKIYSCYINASIPLWKKEHRMKLMPTEPVEPLITGLMNIPLTISPPFVKNTTKPIIGESSLGSISGSNAVETNFF